MFSLYAGGGKETLAYTARGTRPYRLSRNMAFARAWDEATYLKKGLDAARSAPPPVPSGASIHCNHGNDFR